MDIHKYQTQKDQKGLCTNEQKAVPLQAEMKNTHKITMKDIYYRPEWTCGKYNATKHVAIMFNLLANGEYFFEHESADVVGLILAAGRSGEVSVSQISTTLNISPESITPFFDSLIEIGLLSETYPTKEVISSYRKQCAALPNETKYIGNNTEHYLQCDVSTVLQAYDSAVADCTDITLVLMR